MRPIHLEEIARRFPKITLVGAHCGNPEYEWAAEIARWNPNVFFDLSGSTLAKMQGRFHARENAGAACGFPENLLVVEHGMAKPGVEEIGRASCREGGRRQEGSV